MNLPELPSEQPSSPDAGRGLPLLEDLAQVGHPIPDGPLTNEYPVNGLDVQVKTHQEAVELMMDVTERGGL
jgi:hypothetical protein